MLCSSTSLLPLLLKDGLEFRMEQSVAGARCALKQHIYYFISRVGTQSPVTMVAQLKLNAIIMQSRRGAGETLKLNHL